MEEGVERRGGGEEGREREKEREREGGRERAREREKVRWPTLGGSAHQGVALLAPSPWFRVSGL